MYVDSFRILTRALLYFYVGRKACTILYVRVNPKRNKARVNEGRKC